MDIVSPKIFDSLKWDYFGKENAGSDSNNNDENGERVNGNTANSNSSTEAMFLSKTMKRTRMTLSLIPVEITHKRAKNW